MTTMQGVVASAWWGSVGGFLTRPCCVVPAVLSVLGVGGAGLAQAAVTYRPVLLSVSVVVLATSLAMTFRREGGWIQKALSAIASLAAFGLTAAYWGLS